MCLRRLGRTALSEACSGGPSALTALPVFHEGKATRCLDSSTGEEASTLHRALPAIIARTSYEMRSSLVRAKSLAEAPGELRSELSHKAWSSAAHTGHGSPRIPQRSLLFSAFVPALCLLRAEFISCVRCCGSCLSTCLKVAPWIAPQPMSYRTSLFTLRREFRLA